MTKALAMSLLLLAVALSASEAAPMVPNPAAAKQASDALQTRDEAVKAADAKAVATLKKMMTKYKKDTPTLTMLAVKLHKLDPNDADAIAALKDVPADQQDLLGEAAQPGKYLTDVQAKVIADALAKGKFTGKDWEALPGKPIEVSSDYYKATHEGGEVKGMALVKDAVYLVCPNTEDKWRKNKDPLVSYLGSGAILKLQAFAVSANEKREIPIGKPMKMESGGTLELMADSIGWAVGSIRVKVYEIVPIGE